MLFCFGGRKILENGEILSKVQLFGFHTRLVSRANNMTTQVFINRFHLENFFEFLISARKTKYIEFFKKYKHRAFTNTYVRFGNLNLFASYAMLMRTKKAETAVHGSQQSGSLFLWQFKGVKPTTNKAIVPNIVASSQLLARLCYLYLSSSLQQHTTSTVLLP